MFNIDSYEWRCAFSEVHLVSHFISVTAMTCITDDPRCVNVISLSDTAYNWVTSWSIVCIHSDPVTAARSSRSWTSRLEQSIYPFVKRSEEAIDLVYLDEQSW